MNKISLYKVDATNRNTEQSIKLHNFVFTVIEERMIYLNIFFFVTVLIPKPITQNASTNDKKKCTLDPNLLAVLETFSPDSSNNNNNNCNSTSLPDDYHYAMRSLTPQNTNNKSGSYNNVRNV